VRYAVIGATLSGNKGASAMLESSLQHLRKKDADAHFDVLTVYPDQDSELNEDEDVSILDASPLRLGTVINGAALLHRVIPPLRPRMEEAVPEVGALARADILLDEGGITFVDGRGKFLIYNIATVLPALFTRTPVFKVAQAMGPFETFANRTAAKFILPRMAMIIARGDVTLRHLRELGLGNVRRGADLAFTLEVSKRDIESVSSQVDMSFFSGGNVVGFAPSVVLAKSSAKAGRDYVAETARTIDHITDVLDRPVLLLAHSARRGTEKNHNNDLPVCRAIVESVASPEKVMFVDEELNARELRCLIGMCDVFVASRFHAMISALAQATPVVVIGWSHKYGEVMADFGVEEFATALADATPAKVGALVDRATRERRSLHDSISRSMEQVHELALQQIDDITEFARARRKSRSAR